MASAGPNADTTIWMLDLSYGDQGIFSYRPDCDKAWVQEFLAFLLSDGRVVVYDFYQGPPIGACSDQVLMVIDSEGNQGDILTLNAPWIVGVQSGDLLIALEWFEGDPYLSRYFADFTPDPTFSTPPGVVPCCSWAIQPDDRILAESYQDGRIIRLNSDGSLDDAFPTDVGPFNTIDSLTSHTGGGFLVQEWYTTPYYCSARIYEESGSLTGYLYNTSFFHQNNFCHYFIQFAPYPDGGYVWIDTGRKVFRSDGDGLRIFEVPVQSIIDRSFGPNWTIKGASPISVQPDGKILFSGLIENENLNYWYMSRLNPDGRPDLTFGLNGVYAWPTDSIKIGNNGGFSPGGLFVLPDGRIIVVGSGDETIYLARLYEMQVDTTLYFPILGR